MDPNSPYNETVLCNKYSYEKQPLGKLFSEEEKPICPITHKKIYSYFRSTSYCPTSLRDSYLCTLTKKLYYNPVLCNDGFFYEKKAIKERFNNEEYTSPNTGNPISGKIRIVPHFNYMLHLFYRDHPEELVNRYDPHERHCDNIDVVADIIGKKKHHKLLKYKEFDLYEFFKTNSLKKLLTQADENIIGYVIDNIIDLEVPNAAHHNWRLIHYVIRYCNPSIIKLLISKGVNMESHTRAGWKPIHFLCRYADIYNPESINLIKSIIDSGIDLESETNDKWRPVHFICAYCNKDLIEFMLTKNVRFDARISHKKVENVCNNTKISKQNNKIIRTKQQCNNDPSQLLLGNCNLLDDNDKTTLVYKCILKANNQLIKTNTDEHAAQTLNQLSEPVTNIDCYQHILEEAVVDEVNKTSELKEPSTIFECVGPLESVEPVAHLGPIEPVGAVEPPASFQSVETVGTVEPLESIESFESIESLEPLEPIEKTFLRNDIDSQTNTNINPVVESLETCDIPLDGNDVDNLHKLDSSNHLDHSAIYLAEKLSSESCDEFREICANETSDSETSDNETENTNDNNYENILHDAELHDNNKNIIDSVF